MVTFYVYKKEKPLISRILIETKIVSHLQHQLIIKGL